MVDDHIFAVAVMPACGGHRTGRHGVHLCSFGGDHIRALVVAAHPAAHIGITGHRPDQRHRGLAVHRILLPDLTALHRAFDQVQVPVIPHDSRHRGLQGDTAHLLIFHQQALLVVKGPAAHLVQPVRRAALDHILSIGQGFILLIFIFPGHALLLAHPLHAGLALGQSGLFLRLRHGSRHRLPDDRLGLLLQKTQLLQPVCSQTLRFSGHPRRQTRRRTGSQTDGGQHPRRRGQSLAATGSGRLEQGKQTCFQILRPGAHARGSGRQRTRRGCQQHPPVGLTLFLIQPAHRRLVAGQFTQSLHPGGLPVAKRVEPVDPAGQPQRGLAPQIAAVQVG